MSQQDVFLEKKYYITESSPDNLVYATSLSLTSGSTNVGGNPTGYGQTNNPSLNSKWNSSCGKTANNNVIGSSIQTTGNSTTLQDGQMTPLNILEVYKYIKGPDNMVQMFEQSYQQARESFGVEQTGRRRRDEYVDGEPRVVVDAPPPGK